MGSIDGDKPRTRLIANRNASLKKDLYVFKNKWRFIFHELVCRDGFAVGAIKMITKLKIVTSSESLRDGAKGESRSSWRHL